MRLVQDGTARLGKGAVLCDFAAACSLCKWGVVIAPWRGGTFIATRLNESGKAILFGKVEPGARDWCARG